MNRDKCVVSTTVSVAISNEFVSVTNCSSSSPTSPLIMNCEAMSEFDVTASGAVIANIDDNPSSSLLPPPSAAAVGSAGHAVVSVRGQLNTSRHSSMTVSQTPLAAAVVLLLTVFVTSGAVAAKVSHELTMLSKGQVMVVDAGRSIEAPCEYHGNEFSMFENPVIWKKVQADEETPINIMGNILDPFLSTGRFEVTYNGDQAPRYQMTLRISAPVTRLSFEVENYQSPLLIPPIDEVSYHGGVAYGDHQRHPYRTPNEHSYDVADTEMSPKRITFVENIPRKMRCVAVGGFPLPEMQIFVGTNDVTREFSLSHSVTLEGTQGLRAIRYQTERTTDKMAFESREDGQIIRCVVTVPGLAANKTQATINVLYRPVISCPPTYAALRESSVSLRCEVSAQPPLSALFWIIDVNGTTVSEGQVVNEYWTLVMDRYDGVMETQLFMKQVLTSSYRRYTLVAENSIATTTADAELLPKPRASSMAPNAVTLDTLTHVDVIVQPRDVTRRRDPGGEYVMVRSAMMSSSASFLTSSRRGHVIRTNAITVQTLLIVGLFIVMQFVTANRVPVT